MKRIVTMALAIIMLLSCFPVPAQAAEFNGQALGMAAIGSGGYQTMTTSQKMLDVLKVTEGFSAEPYWDYAQWTIGYGSYAGSREYFNKPSITVTPEEAEVMLKQQLADSYEKSVNNYCKGLGKQPTQNQFDALVSFTYNLGAGWMSGSMLSTWLKNPTTELDFVNAMGRWVRAGGKMLFALAQRRIREAIIFLKGEYSLPYKASANHCVKTDLPVIKNEDLPYYASVIYQYDYSTSSVGKGNGHEIGYFAIDSTYDPLVIPTRDGYYFSGWKITRIDNSSTSAGTMVTASTTVKENLELTAVWSETAPVVPDVTEPPEENPDETEPPEDTVTEPTDPEVPDETEPPEDDPEDPFPFEDVEVDDWFRISVEFVYDNELMYGKSENLFDPHGSMTRAMLVTVLYRLDGSPEVTQEQREAFEDIGDRYYTDAVAWAKANGIVAGITDTRFYPDREVTRQEAVAIFHRYCVDYLQIEGTAAESLDDFVDADEVDEYALDAVKWAVGVQLISGSVAGDELYLRSDANLSRCQSATMLTRMLTEIIN